LRNESAKLTKENQVGVGTVFIFHFCRIMKRLLISVFVWGSFHPLLAQDIDSLFISRLFQAALGEGKVYEDLRVLCKTAGPRISGSAEAGRAVDYTHAKMNEYGFDTVFRQEVEVPRWERGKEDSLRLDADGGVPGQAFPVCALGGSVAGELRGKVVEVLGWNDLQKLGKENIQGKIVFFNRPMDARMVHTFGAYGTCVDQRVYGAVWAAYYGAGGVIIRSMNPALDDYPHTGTLIYADSVARIPAVAISTNGAEQLSRLLKENPELSVKYSLFCRSFPDTLSHNVVGEIKGGTFPEKYIVVGGHLDAWDLGEGAHDDGGGCMQSIEALRLLKDLGYVPRHSLRSVMWMNEENGLKGALKYAELAEENKEYHVAAIEADRGAFTPRGFFIEGSEDNLLKMRSWLPLLEPYGIHVIRPGGAGADVSPLKKKEEKPVLIGFIPDSQRYFDYHHAATDTFESVNKRELEMGAAALAALIYLIDRHGTE
jgi:carboxypeptidase Q